MSWVLAHLTVIGVGAAFLVSLILIVACTASMTFVSPVHLYFYFYSFYVLIWVVLLHASGEPTYVGSASVDTTSPVTAWLVGIGLLCFSLGAVAVAVGSGFRPTEALASYRARALVSDVNDDASVVALMIIFALGAGLAVSFFVMKGIPLAAYLEAGSDSHFFRAMSEARAESLVGSGYLMQGITTILPIGILLLSAHAATVQRWPLTALALLCVVGVIAAMFSLTSRGHFVMFLVLLFVVNQTVRGGVKWKRMVTWIIVSFLLFSISSLVKFGLIEQWTGLGPAMAASVTILADRLALGVRQLYALVSIFPREHDFLLGRGLFWDVRALLPGADIGFNRWAFDLLYPASAVPANITPTSVGEWYANFGVAGVVMGSAMLGAILQFTHQCLLKPGLWLSARVSLVFLAAYEAKSAINGQGAVAEPLISGIMTILLFFLIRWFLRGGVKGARSWP
ncbi:MAG: oligosaccharide repeat unit polymerase [Gammaproteobacteria bacterium]|nr:MAG: oligosaccharide repeat unit polymerase [Gammaproteobacteria bacterium]